MPGVFGRLLPFLYDRVTPNLKTMWASRQPMAWLLALVIGVVAAYGILAFRYLILGIQFP